jgi:hypothetical protein
MKKPVLKPKAQKGMPAIHQMAVERLAHGLEPVKPATPPLLQWLSWLGVAAIVVCLLFFYMPLRADLSLSLKSPPFDLMMIFIFSGAVLAAWGAIEASFPGEESGMKWKLILSCILWIAAGLLFVFFIPWKAENYMDHITPLPCFVVVFLIGSLFWVGLGILVRGNAPLSPGRVGLWSGLSSFLVGLGVITLHCDSHNLYHVCFEHFLPVFVYSWLVGWLGAKWVSAWKRKSLPPVLSRNK